MTTHANRTLSLVLLALGLLSIIASIGIWAFYRGDDRAHAERFGIFVGLWAPTFIALSTRVQSIWRSRDETRGSLVTPPLS